MAQFSVDTTPEEQEIILEVLRHFEGQTVPVSAIAEKAGMRPSRARYALIDLIEAGKVERIVSKAFNKRYIRYSYKIL